MCREFPVPDSRSRRRVAFTLLEMMVVLVLIGLLAGLVGVSTRHYLVKGKQNAARAQISSLCTAVDTFYGVYSRYPTNEEGLAILTRKTTKIADPLLKQLPMDPWDRPYQYNRPGRNQEYEIICLGADGREGGEGADADIASWDLRGSTGKAGP